MQIFELEETDSTNSWVNANRSQLPIPSLTYALRQTAGRGQRGNSWESEPGKNLCCSALLRPEGIAPQRQFSLSEAVALAVTDLLSDCGVEAMVKWPNDIYVGDKKICGILIENAITPTDILHSIAGIGLNVNQREFLSDAPNPVSLVQLLGAEFDITGLAVGLADKLETRMEMASQKEPSGAEQLHKDFMERLWRGDGKRYPFLDRLRGERIEASIAGVAPDGIITLDTGCEQREYAFKEIEFII